MSVKFIEDKEFDLSNSENQDLLGTKPYAETLFEVIKQSKGKQNIGLFGGWGSGKSTIIKTLENFILENNKEDKKDKIAYFKYDAWKYSNDDFRRSFIRSLNEEFSAILETDLEEILYQDITKENSNKTKVQPSYQKLLPYAIGLIVIILAYSFFFSSLSGNEKFLLLVFSIFSSFIFTISGNFFRVIPHITRQSKIIEPEKFEDTFRDITNDIFGISKKNIVEKIKDKIVSKTIFKKMVVVIDNLDRCDKENLMVTLSSIKNFLENDNIIFILPVDENGITSFLNGDSDDADEYLRKIFHQIIRLKKFTPKELVDFTKALNKNYNLELSSIGTRLICQEFTNNPRKIIQFLNNLQTERDLIDRQIKEGYVKLEYTTQADDFLIKLLIIKQEWNSLYKRVLDDINFLNKINTALKYQINQTEDKFIIKIDNQDFGLTRNQKRFFKRNIDVHFSNVEPFILNIDRDKDIPDELREYIENGELNEIYDLLSIDVENNLTKENVELLLNQIENVYDYNSNKFEDYKSIALPVSEMLFEVLVHEKFQNEIKDNLKSYSFINRIFSNNQFNDIIPNLNDFKEFCNSAKWFYFELNYKKLYNILFDFLKRSINPDTTIKGIHGKIQIFINVFEKHPGLIKGLSSNLKSKILEDNTLLTDYKVFKDNLEITQSLLDSEFIDKMLELLNENKIEDKKVIDVLINITDEYIEKKYIKDQLILSEFTNYFFGKLKTEYNLKSTTAKGVFEIKDIIYRLNKLILKTDLEILDVDEILFDTIHTKLIVEYRSGLNDDEIDFYIEFYRLLFNYMKLNNDFALVANMEKYFNSHFIRTDYKKLSLGINGIYQNIVNHFAPFPWNFFDIIIGKLKVHKEIAFYKTLMLMFNKTKDKKGLTEVQKSVLMDNVLQYFFYSKGYPTLTNISGNWLSDIYKKEKELYSTTLDNLSPDNLEKYVYDIHTLKNDDLICNSFVNYLNTQSNFSKFQKFVRFIGVQHKSKIQEKLLLEVCSKKHPPYDWIFSAKKFIHKSAFNNIIKSYVEHYNHSPINTNYLNNFLKLNKKDLYQSTIESILKLAENLKNPTKRHKSKVSALIMKFK
ncbi:P-loop NTPase fold protein [Mariniflexile sp. HNIBRBA6329]|uniref:KAP family P-loop NTPase fold protein n=1 Tax=Mariniflexile sp. HNIBRBA6329 TaxID=3373088 RepID=UPI003745FA8B